MKLMRYNIEGERTGNSRLGILLSGDIVGDLRAGYARCLNEHGHAQAQELAALLMPPNIAQFLALGEPGWAAVHTTVDYLEALGASDRAAMGLSSEPLLTPLRRCQLHAPIQPSKMIAVGRNYASHLKAAGAAVPEAVIPSAWIKANSAITGPTNEIVKPACTQELDYETELAVVISHRCKNVPAEKAYDVIAGYTIVNDISARDIGRLERKQGNHLLDKMFDGFAPMGPWLVTKDEIQNPMNLRIVTRVNGEIRQNGNTKEMTWSIPQLIAYLSQMTLEPGDIIMTGTPEGTAVERKSDPYPGYLKGSDVLESEVESIGTLRNKIAEDVQGRGSWAW